MGARLSSKSEASSSATGSCGVRAVQEHDNKQLICGMLPRTVATQTIDRSETAVHGTLQLPNLHPIAEHTGHSGEMAVHGAFQPSNPSPYPRLPVFHSHPPSPPLSALLPSMHGTMYLRRTRVHSMVRCQPERGAVTGAPTTKGQRCPWTRWHAPHLSLGDRSLTAGHKHDAPRAPDDVCCLHQTAQLDAGREVGVAHLRGRPHKKHSCAESMRQISCPYPPTTLPTTHFQPPCSTTPPAARPNYPVLSPRSPYRGSLELHAPPHGLQ